ncbi:hypothetical protein Jiend_60240 [Micromonospora endophytica]|uniref:hypothetical protein n=1 Tax=Micromonospora endophytica TaxID=515350 RepID=UPI001C3276F7|nr:hypothetical protein [Micromonospora endophytica]BCJ62602.1 hypothetical protein Jiend_60240 [Micromonospora endophytica]
MTPDGERVLAQARQVSARIEADVLATLSEEEREVFVRATRRLVDERFSGRCGPAC